MKHYFNVSQTSPENNTTNVVKIFAPFDGKVIWDNTTLDAPRGHQMLFTPTANPTMGLEIFHINPLSGITTGSAIKAGQLVGYAALNGGNGFDIDINH